MFLHGTESNAGACFYSYRSSSDQAGRELLRPLASAILRRIRDRACRSDCLAALSNVLADVVITGTVLRCDAGFVFGAAGAFKVAGFSRPGERSSLALEIQHMGTLRENLLSSRSNIASLLKWDRSVVARSLAADLHVCAWEFAADGFVDAGFESYNSLS